MPRYHSFIVDDEAPARAKIKRFLDGDERFVLAGEADNGSDALAALDRQPVDLVFLDVQMPGLSGFEVLEALGDGAPPAVIFSTAFDRYAVRAFDAAAVDYLLKPYDRDRFARALDKAHARLDAGDRDVEPAGRAAAEWRAQSGAPLERLLAKEGESWIPLPLDRVTRLSAEDKYVRVYSDGRETLVRQTIKALAEQIDPRRFVRVHRGEVVALDAVARLEPWSHGDAVLVLKDGSSVVLSRTYREAFLRRWGVG